MVFIRSYKGQTWLLPPNVEELIPYDHVCYLVESLVDSLDFSSFEVKYSGPGHPAYHPRVLLKPIVMGGLDRMRSSRRLARNIRENVVYMYLAEKLTPDFRTINDFRKNNPKLVKEVFKHTVILAKQEGMLDLSHLSTDGSKVKANAANKRILTKKELEFLRRFVDEELEEWAKQDNFEDDMFDNLRGSDQLPNKRKKETRKVVKYYIRKIKDKGNLFKEETAKKLEQAYQELEKHELEKVSTTDPESRFMKNKKGKIELSYNIQVSVDKKGFILANDVCQDANDTKQLQPQVLQTEMNVGTLPENGPWSFDNNYFEGENLKFLSDKKIDGYIPDHEQKVDDPYDKKHFVYDPIKDEYTCPAKQVLTFSFEYFDKTKKKSIKVYKGQTCNTCSYKSECTKNKKGIRYMKAYPHETERNAMTSKMRTEQANEVYKLRAQIVEPVIGDIKENKGVQTFLTKSLETVRTEFNLTCTACNLKKIWAYLQKKNDNLKNNLQEIIQKTTLKFEITVHHLYLT